MSDQIFPPEILDLFLDELGLTIEDPESQEALLACIRVNRQFYHKATSYIFSSLTISRRAHKRLRTLRDILNVNPDIARHIRSFTVEAGLSPTEHLPAVFKQLGHLQEFRWICKGINWDHDSAIAESIEVTNWDHEFNIAASIENLCNPRSLTTLHLEKIANFQLSLLSTCCYLESLTLVTVKFAEMESDSLSSSLFSSLKRLEVRDIINDSQVIEKIMTCAAQTLTTLILCNPRKVWGGVVNLNSIVLPALASIKMSCTITPRDRNDLPDFLLRFLNYSAAPMVNHIQIEFEPEFEESYNDELDQPLVLGLISYLTYGWSPIDEILSCSTYPSLKTLDLIFWEKYSINTGSDVLPLPNEILPALSSRGQTEMKIRDPSFEPVLVHPCVEIHFIL